MPYDYMSLDATEDPTVEEVAVGLINMAAYVDDSFGPESPAYGQGIYELCMWDNLNISDEIEARFAANREAWEAFIEAFLAIRRKTQKNARELKRLEEINS